MPKTIKNQVAKALSGNTNLNKKSLQMKKSWDEVQKLLQSSGSRKKGK
jgi:hypothetical protein